MVAINSLLFAAVAVSSIAYASSVPHFEPLIAREVLPFDGVVAFQPLDTVPATFTPASASSSGVTKTSPFHQARAAHLSARSTYTTNLRQGYRNLWLNNAVVNARSEVTSSHTEISRICSNHNGQTQQQVANNLRTHLDRCHHAVSDCSGNAGQIPHRTCPSQPVQNPPTNTGCSGNLAGLINELSEILEELRLLARTNAAVLALYNEYRASFDSRSSELLSNSETAVTGITTQTADFCGGHRSQLSNQGFHALASRFSWRN